MDAYLAAVGRTSNSDGLGLDSIGVQLDEFGCVKVRIRYFYFDIRVCYTQRFVRLTPGYSLTSQFD